METATQRKQSVVYMYYMCMCVFAFRVWVFTHDIRFDVSLQIRAPLLLEVPAAPLGDKLR